MAIISKLINDYVALGRPIEDGFRPEVKVTIASVYVSGEDENKGNINFTFKADGAKFKLGGYINSSEPVAQVIKLAAEKNEPICVRLEKKRKKNVDPKLGIEEISNTMDVARENIVKTVVGVFDFRTNKWVLTGEAQSSPDEDPAGLLDQIKGLNFQADNFFDSAPEPSGQPIVSNAQKEKENAENALMTMYFFLVEQEKEHGYTLNSSTRREYAIQLLKLSNLIQMQTFNLEAPSFSAYSHTRARYLVFKWAEVMSPLNGEAIKNFGPWCKAVLKNGSALWGWCQEEVDSL